MSEEKILLPISIEYGVRWTKEQTLRDFVQNFYDGTGWKRFNKDFVCSYSDGIMKMEARGEGFGDEWLRYLGTSTKRDKAAAGRFGEGFKIAALAAYRDFGWSVWMESKEWRIHITEEPQLVDGKSIAFLAYDKEVRKDDHCSVLTIGSVTQKDYETAKKAVQDFFYPGHPRCAKEICGEMGYAGCEWGVFEAAEGNGGAIFIRGQLRAELPIPLVFFDMGYSIRDDKRDRPRMDEIDVTDFLCSIAYQMNPSESFAVLERLEKAWGSGKYVAQGWKMDLTEFINKLATFASYSLDCLRRFRERYGGSVVVDDMGGRDRAVVAAWFKSSPYYKRRRVMRAFRSLGTKSIRELCEEEGGFAIGRKPDGEEAALISILHDAARDALDGIILYDELPRAEVYDNEEAKVDGVAETTDIGLSGREANELGLRKVSLIRKIRIKSSLLRGTFGQAFSVFSHELLHEFGGDGSASFHRAIMALCQRTIEKGEILDGYRKEWENRQARNSEGLSCQMGREGGHEGFGSKFL